MSTPFTAGNVSLDLFAGSPQAAPARVVDERTPLRIVVIGDFSGRGSRAVQKNLAECRPISIDRDDFDAVFERLNVQLRLTLPGGGELDLAFRELDDFTPDRLFERVELFASLRSLRRRLQNPKSFDQAAAEVNQLSQAGDSAATPRDDFQKSGDDSPAPVSDAALLDSILGQSPPKPLEAQLAAGPVDWDAYVRDLVAPYVVPKSDPRQAEYVASVDEATGEQMRRLLHHPRFQQMEALWRGMFLLVRQLETGRSLKISLLDLSDAELEAALETPAGGSESPLSRLLSETSTGVPGGSPWGLLLLDREFGETEQDLDLLEKTAVLAGSIQSPVAAAAGLDLVDALLADDEEHAKLRERFAAFRQSPAAGWLSLAAPRMLLRLPYGGESDPTDQFAFEEVPSGLDEKRRLASYLWGNGCFAVGWLIGRNFSRAGWRLFEDFDNQLEGLPVHVYEGDGGKELQTPSERLLTTDAISAWWQLGLTPLATVRDRDVLFLPGLRSVSQSAPRLAGLWGA